MGAVGCSASATARVVEASPVVLAAAVVEEAEPDEVPPEEEHSVHRPKRGAAQGAQEPKSEAAQEEREAKPKCDSEVARVPKHEGEARPAQEQRERESEEGIKPDLGRNIIAPRQESKAAASGLGL